MEAVIAASIRLFAEPGLNSVSMRDIASAANVNLGLIVRHFSTKDTLAKEVGLTIVGSILDEVIEKGSSIFDVMVNGLGDHSLKIQALTRIIIDDKKATTVQNAKSLFDRLFEWIQGQQRQQGINPSIDPMALLFIISSLVMGGEIFGPHLNAIMEFSDSSYEDIKPRIVETIITLLKR